MSRIMGGEYDRHESRIMGFHLTEFVAQELGLQYELPGYQGMKKDSPLRCREVGGSSMGASDS
jgi:hypothetical protein